MRITEAIGRMLKPWDYVDGDVLVNTREGYVVVEVGWGGDRVNGLAFSIPEFRQDIPDYLANLIGSATVYELKEKTMAFAAGDFRYAWRFSQPFRVPRRAVLEAVRDFLESSDAFQLTFRDEILEKMGYPVEEYLGRWLIVVDQRGVGLEVRVRDPAIWDRLNLIPSDVPFVLGADREFVRGLLMKLHVPVGSRAR